MKNKRLIFVSIITVIFIISVAVAYATAASAEEGNIIDSGECGEFTKWDLDNKGTLTVYGSGSIFSGSSLGYTWNKYADTDKIKDVVICDGVTEIGWYAFSEIDSIQSLYLGKDINMIDDTSFRGLPNLKAITVSEENTNFDSRNNCNAIIKTIDNSLVLGSESTIIPDNVICIADYAFECRKISSLTIPDNVTEIGSAAFQECQNLKHVTIPNKVTCIEDSTFAHCTSLLSIEIPNTIECFGYGAFAGCTSLQSIIIPDKVTSIPDFCLQYCTSLSSIDIPDSVEYIGSASFAFCSSLQSVIIPDRVTYIGTDAFSHCSALAKIIIPESVKVIEGNAFGFCISLESIIIPANVTDVGAYLFVGCQSLKSVKILCQIDEIGACTFNDCILLEEVELPESIISIDNYAFQNCWLLELIVLPDNIVSIGEGVFQNCSSLIYINIPQSIKVIEQNSFASCSSLQLLTIPDTVSSIGCDAFWGVQSISYSGPLEGAPWGAQKLNGYTDGVFTYLDETKKTLIRCNTDISGEVTVPDSVTKIESYAFANCKKITKLIIPQSVKNIGYNVLYNTALYSNENNWQNELLYLDDILISSKGTDISYIIKNGTRIVSDRVFENRDDIITVGIPSSVETIGVKAFYCCEGLKNPVVPKEVKSVGADAFKSVNNVIYEGSLSTEEWGADYYNGITDGYLTYSDDSKKELIVCNADSASSVIVPDSVEKIASFAFYGCNNITEITLPFVGTSKTATDDEVYFGYIFGLTDKDNINAFVPRSIKKVTITSAEVISEGAFRNCDHIEEMVLPFVGKTADSVGKEGCFGYIFGTSAEKSELCSEQKYSNEESTYCFVPDSLTKITVTDDESIPYGAFYGLENITSITLSEKTVSIGANSVYGTGIYNDITNWDHRMLCLNGYKFAVDYDDKKAQPFSGKIPSETIVIADNCFEGASIRTLELNSNLKYIGNCAFADCTNLRSVTGGENVESYGEQAFSGCRSLTYIEIPISAKSLPNSVFDSNLDNLEIRYASSKADWKKLNAYFDESTVYYTLSSDDNRAIVIYCDDDVKYEAGNIELEKVQVRTVDKSDSQTFNYQPESGFYEYRDANPYGIFDIKLINNNGDEIQPEKGKTVTLKIKATDGFRNMLIGALNNFDGVFEDIVISDGNIYYSQSSKTPECTTDEVITDEFLRLIHFYSEKYNGAIYQSYDIKDVVLENGYFILNIPHFSEFSIVGNNKDISKESNSIVVGDSINLETGEFAVTKFTIEGTGATVDQTGRVVAHESGKVTVIAWNGTDKVKTFEITINPCSCGILKYQKNRSVDYKTTMIFHFEGNRPENSSLLWYVNGERAGEGEEITIASPTNDFVIEARVITPYGTVCSEVEKVSVKHGFFDKISWFFKNIFKNTEAIIDQK